MTVINSNFRFLVITLQKRYQFEKFISTGLEIVNAVNMWCDYSGLYYSLHAQHLRFHFHIHQMQLRSYGKIFIGFGSLI